ncbi:MAG TPA: glucose 1-dehydrogenase [Roseiflexaceae bacterium]|nr:glucose 1-dehydrogenase [Roseiflexaceae bacterium]
MGKLDGKVAVVTGGGSGIGFAAARAFVDEGARVVISGRTEEALARAASELGPEALAVRADVASMADLERLFATAKERFGGVDVLFVNAGIVQATPFQDVTEQAFDELFNINFKGAFFTIQRALPVLNSGGSIILNGSINAHVGFGGVSVYSASKAALHSLARTLTPELAGRGIRINTLNIGPVITELMAKAGLPEEAISGFRQALNVRVPLGRWGRPEEIARAAVFLASDDSSFIAGSEITTDGGLLVHTLT